MSEQSTETATQDPEPSQGNPDDGTDALGDAGKKALDAMKAKWKDAEKSATSLQAQLDEINRANESAVEKAAREATEYKEVAAKATAEALRYRIAAESGITENADLILTASDEETMRKQAALWGARTPTAPRPDLSQGGAGTPATGSPEQDFANFLGAQMGA